jgi:hypothetical protein
MQSQNDWLQILVHCKENVKERVHPHLKTAREPQDGRLLMCPLLFINLMVKDL